MILVPIYFESHIWHHSQDPSLEQDSTISFITLGFLLNFGWYNKSIFVLIVNLVYNLPL